MPEKSVIKSYDNSLKANWGRAKGKFRENVPESWRTVLPYLSDAEDALGMQEAFSKDGTTKDRVIALAGLSIPFISTAVLKRFLKSDKVKKLLGSDVGNTAYEQALNEVSSDSPNIEALEDNLKQLEKKWGLSFEELNSPRIKGKDLKVATEAEDLGIGKYLQSGTIEYDNGFQLRKYTNPQNNSEDVFLMYDPKTENNIAYIRKYGQDPNSKEFIPTTIPENTFHIKADMGNLPKEDVKFAMEELQKVLPPKHSIYESSNISPEGLKLFEQQKNFGYSPTDKTFTTKISNAGRQGSMFSDLNRYGHNSGDQFSEARFLDDNSLNTAISRVNDYQKQIGTKYNVYPTTQGRGINIDLPYLQRQYATGGEMKQNTNSNFNPTSLSGYSVYALGGYPQMYGLGGKRFFWDGGFTPVDRIQGISPNFTNTLNTTTLDPMTTKAVNGASGLSPGITQGLSVAGQGLQDITNAYRPDKANYGSNIGGGALKGAATGAAIGSIVPGVGTVVGGVVGGAAGALGGLTKSVVKSAELKQEREKFEQQQRDALKKETISNLPAQQNYVPTFANGGELSYLPSITNFTTPINTDLTIEKNPMFLDRSRFRRMGPSFRVEANKLDEYIDNIAGHLNTHNFPQKEREAMQYRQSEFRKLKEDLFNYQENPDTKKFKFADGGSIHIKPENRGKFTAAAKWHEMGGLLDSYAGDGYMNTFGANLDNTTVYANGGTHESNPYSGIQVGNNSLVEEDEVRFGNYIFSNRIPFKKK